MSFDITTRTLLEHYTNAPPRTTDVWYGTWISILTTLFPSSQGYVVTPQHRIAEDAEVHILNLFIQVAKPWTIPVTLRIVLIVEIKNSQHWESGKTALMRQIELKTDVGFVGAVVNRV
ncbi:hypothetical protein D9756_010122 [Leucocoprinus leucothites]|uniref:Uncharacterized protein n=1 Tax=Leucocoprinus leucothites TaxID=201217 RepID=A0A8H5CU68_9AGAR|nr:hypothetical protein D9756_010122 [Leucoagaricus leucothites]